MNMMIAMTISPGAVTAAVRAIVFGKAWPIMPPPAATSTRKNVPKSSENSRRHSCFGSLKSSIGVDDLGLEPVADPALGDVLAGTHLNPSQPLWSVP